MAAQIATVFGVQAVRAHHHNHGIPAHIGAQALFHHHIPGRVHLVFDFNRVDISGSGRERQIDAVLPRLFQQLLDQEMSAFTAVGFNHGFEGIEPLTRL